MAILVRMRKIDYCQMLVVVTMIIVYVTKIIHSTVVMFFFTGSENDTDDENMQKFLEAKFEFWHCPKQCQ
jgi:hypothetical protein